MVIVPRYRFPSILLSVLRSHLIYRTIYLTNLTNIIVFILIISAFCFAFLFFCFFFYFFYQSLLIFALNIWVFLSTLIGYYLYRLSNLILFPSFLHYYLPNSVCFLCFSLLSFLPSILDFLPSLVSFLP